MELKLISVCILGASLVLSACAKSGNEISKTQNTNVVAENTMNNENKVLVAYFAYSENIGDTSAMNIDAITSASLNGDTKNKEGNFEVVNFT
ncbi:MAG: hypothetical protein IJS61_06450 [Firmicutes bacterium]|nr:hypothetical protein [Bacillota bacterium]